MTGVPPGRHALDGTMRLGLAEALMLPTGLVTLAFLTRSLGAGDYGVFALAATAIAWIEWSLASMFSRATNLWVGVSGDWVPAATTALRVYLGTSLVVASLVVLGADLLAAGLGEPELAGPLRLFALDIPLFCLAAGHRSILVARGGFRERAWLSAVRWLSRMALILILVGLGLGVTGAILATFGASLLELLVARRFIRPPILRGSGFPARRLAVAAGPLLLLGVTLRLFDSLDLYLVKVLGATTAQAGLFGAAKSVALVPSLFAQAFSPVLLSTLMRLRREGHALHAQAMAADAVRLVILVVPFAAVAAGAAPELMTWIAGEEFAAAGGLLRLLVLAAMAMVMVSVTTAILISVDRAPATLVIAVPMVLTAVLCHLWAVPRYGPAGAAGVSAVVATAGGVAGACWLASGEGIVMRGSSLLRAMLFGGGGFAMAVIWEVPGWFALGKLGLLSAAVAAGYLLTGEFNARERALARSLLPWPSTSRS